MNNQPIIEAYNSFLSRANALYASGNIPEAREAYLRAAELANRISAGALSSQVRMEYRGYAEKILKFVKVKCSGEKPVANADGTDSGNSDGAGKLAFTPQQSASGPDKVTFADVAGLEDVKEQITFKVLAPLQKPELAKKYHIRAGGKILLYGPPGTGKTFIARAIAGEVDAEFFAVNCQDLISKYMGDSSKQLDSLFGEAEKHERAIIFFDEFDSVASKRSDSTGGVDAEIGRQLHRAAHPLGDVAERAVGEDRGIERRIEIVGIGDDAPEVLADQIGMVAQCLRDRAEDDLSLIHI